MKSLEAQEAENLVVQLSGDFDDNVESVADTFSNLTTKMLKEISEEIHILPLQGTFCLFNGIPFRTYRIGFANESQLSEVISYIKDSILGLSQKENSKYILFRKFPTLQVDSPSDGVCFETDKPYPEGHEPKRCYKVYFRMLAVPEDMNVPVRVIVEDTAPIII